MSRLDVLPLPERDASGGRVIITSPYGMRWGRLHAGVDMGTTDGIEMGTTVHGPADGTVVRRQDDGPAPSAGLNLWFQADDGRRWKMFHLSAVTVPVGTHVRAGQVIARVGNSGTEAPHLHLEEHVGSWSNPVDCTADVAECIAAGRFPGAALPSPTPPVTPATPTPQPAPPVHDQEPRTMLAILYFAGKPERWALGYGPDGEWCHLIDSTDSLFLLEMAGVPVWELGAKTGGNDILDATFKRLTGL